MKTHCQKMFKFFCVFICQKSKSHITVDEIWKNENNDKQTFRQSAGLKIAGEEWKNNSLGWIRYSELS